jgi:hypothetical protein
MSAISSSLMKLLVEEHGKNVNAWPSELQDLINPSIKARPVGTPENGKIVKRLNLEFEYFWAKDVCGQTPDHSRVEGLRYAGWEYATTDDVVMANDFVVKGRDKSKKTKDGGEGFANEIRNGDLRLMKCPMEVWRGIRKGHNMAAMQLAYPQAYSSDGKPMTAATLTPGMHTSFVDDATIEEMRRGSVVSDINKDFADGEPSRGNTSVAKLSKG